MIKEIRARQLLDSRGNPTVEAEVKTENGIFKAIVPSGASTGIFEALELRDNDPTYFNGKGVLKAVENVNNIINDNLIGMDETKQKEIDYKMLEIDGTENKSNLGANAILSVSLAVARAGACAKKIELYEYINDLLRNEHQMHVKMKMPIPSFNVINGGKHADNKLDFQEFMLMPIHFDSFSDSLRAGAEIYHILKGVIKEKYGSNATNVGDEGGFAPNVESAYDALNLLRDAIKKSGYEGKIKIALDAAASEFFIDGKYHIDGKELNSEELANYYNEMVEKYPEIISIEDPFEQNDFDGYAKLLEKVKGKIQIVGDDLLVTNVDRIKLALEKKACDALLLKVNQIGSLTESLQAVKLSYENNWKVMTSHRSGETEDTFIADLVVGIASGQIKTGAPCRSERLAKYNQLLRISEKITNFSGF
ncbi:MAG: phosphopyruvate hydratase [Candidatus Nanoarchaeia archaeon]|nr:phosphopyruvate hydratase [Candidatus Nanoarchaeia archaeon]